MHPSVLALWSRQEQTDVAPCAPAPANAHPRDERIIFREHDHFYAISDGTVWLSAHLTSATKVIEPFSHPFPARTIAGNIARSQVKKAAAFKAALSRGDFFLYSPEERAMGNMYRLALTRIRDMDPAARKKLFDDFFGEYAGLETADAVLAHWQAGTRFGTHFHLDIESAGVSKKH